MSQTWSMSTSREDLGPLHHHHLDSMSQNPEHTTTTHHPLQAGFHMLAGTNPGALSRSFGICMETTTLSVTRMESSSEAFTTKRIVQGIGGRSVRAYLHIQVCFALSDSDKSDVLYIGHFQGTGYRFSCVLRCV